ncbi:autotransporter domain-containing protein [Maridesulfovibrio sp.]|uniref:autotransporter outer membrane beta-barrel domain-containing protein n=1 Tax=Maridesulfovibrio sp. TaxID=2795000 RepID=UPI0029CA8FDA|nr:autotransporter domain-containing protein [Maridesulfovibrio sp.]
MKIFSGCYRLSSIALIVIFILAFGFPAVAMATGSSSYALKVSSTETVNLPGGTFSVEDSDTDVYGIYSTESLLNIGLLGTGTKVSATTTGTGFHSYGLYSTDINITTLAGTVSASAENAVQAFGLYAEGDENDGNLNIGTLSGTITATGTNAAAAGLWATGSTAGRGKIDISTLSGMISASSSNNESYGIYASGSTNITTLSGTVSTTASGTVSSQRQVYTNGIDSSGGISILNYETGAIARGLGNSNVNIGTLSGTVSTTSADGSAYGLYSPYDGITIGTLSGNVTTKSLGGTYVTADNFGNITTVKAPAYGLYSDSISIGTLSGTVSTTSAEGNAYSLYSSGTLNGGNTDTAMLISGSVEATGATAAYALYADGATNVHITGTIKATATSGTAYAIKTGNNADKVTLDTGANLTGEVDLGAGTDTLTLLGSGTTSSLFSNIENLVVGDGESSAGWIWGAGSSASAFNSINIYSGAELSIGSDTSLNTNNLTVNHGGTLNIAAYGQSSASVTATTATIEGTLEVDPSAESISTSSQILSASSSLNTASVISSNPNFTVTRTDNDASGTVTVSTSFTPHNDESSLGTAATLAGVQAFANVAQSRNLTMLADSGEDSDKEILVASSGSLVGLLNARKPETSWGMYLQPVFSRGSRDGNSDSEGYDSYMAGLEIGVDRKFGENLVLGIMGGIGATQINFSGSDFVSGDSEVQQLYIAGVYGGYKFMDWTFSDTLSTTYATHESSRNAGMSQTAKGDYDSILTSNQFTARYHWQPVKDWEVVPCIGLNITHLHRAGFSETDATNAISYDTLDKTFADGILGVRVKYDIQIEDTLVTPYAGIGVIHSLGSNDITVRQYLPTTSAQVTTENDSNRLTPELGVIFGKKNASFTLSYAGEYGETTDSHSIFGVLRMDF